MFALRRAAYGVCLLLWAGFSSAFGRVWHTILRMARRMLQFSLAAWFRLILIVAIGLTVIPEEYWPGIAWAGLALVVTLVGAASFFIAMVAVYEVFEAGFWLCEACSKLYRRALRVSS